MDPSFAALLLERSEQDVCRGRTLTPVLGLAAVDHVAAALSQLQQDRTHEDDNGRFILAMSYADEGQAPSIYASYLPSDKPWRPPAGWRPSSARPRIRYPDTFLIAIRIALSR